MVPRMYQVFQDLTKWGQFHPFYISVVFKYKTSSSIRKGKISEYQFNPTAELWNLTHSAGADAEWAAIRAVRDYWTKEIRHYLCLL